MAKRIANVIVDSPIREPLDYLVPADIEIQVGQRCLVPLGTRKVVGIVVGFSEESRFSKLREVISRVDDIAPLSFGWLALTSFAARYYQSGWGQVAIPALPKFFRKLPGKLHERSLERLRKEKKRSVKKSSEKPQLNSEQSAIVEEVQLDGAFYPALIFGITGSGKTEVYLHLMEKVLLRDPEAQVLLMVPEINLTPQLVEKVQSRFPQFEVVSWNSGMAEGQKASSWLACHEGRARILVGTRLSVFASFKSLKLILVDEEHDPSFKSQEGVRYNARDLALKRASIEQIPIVLGSATPSLESYKNALDGKFKLFKLTQRANSNAHLPQLSLVDIRKDKPINGLSQETANAITETINSGRQVIVFLNRRGFAPVVECKNCGWQSTCPHCSTYSVFHKTTGRLTCHYCGWSTPLPKTCPKCGSYELLPIGRGTQRAEEELETRWPEARVSRLDQDSARQRGSASQVLDAVHNGDVDILIGTQIVAKGHDFKNVGLVVVLNTDPQLFSSDYRARERLFSVLMQVSGRAGRDKTEGKVLIQTRYTEDDIFKHLKSQDYEGFAAGELEARRASFMVPFSAQALIVAEGKEISSVLAFLQKLKALAEKIKSPSIRIFEPVPLTVQKVMDIERGQLLIEADSKVEMQKFLNRFQPEALSLKAKGSWYIDVDPLNY